MHSAPPPDFATIADASTKAAFLHGYPEMVEWLPPGTKLFKWTQSITSHRGVSPWWQFLESKRLPNGGLCAGIRDNQEYADRVGAHDRDYARARVAVTEQWNKMTNPVAIELLRGAWGYIGKAAGQLKNLRDPKVSFIGGEYQVWVPGLLASDVRRISLGPYLTPNKPFHPR